MIDHEQTPEELLMEKRQLVIEMATLLDKLFTDPNMGELLIRFHNNTRYIRFTKDGRFFYSSNTGKIGP